MVFPEVGRLCLFSCHVRVILRWPVCEKPKRNADVVGNLLVFVLQFSKSS